ncbi:MAG: hypothetical protein JO334_12675 [Verrucomicrobia bacterium]|nr:hypothetical protein [Verrucomicrobiota bacterium]
MKSFVLLMVAPAFFGCALTPNVNTRKPGQPWNYYGDLVNVYRDQTRGAKVELIWLDQVQFERVDQRDFQKKVQNYLRQGYRKIGIVSVRSQYFVDPYELKKLAADKGARLVVGCWFAAREKGAKSRMLEYWYQLLDKPVAPAERAVSPTPALVPAAPLPPLAPTGPYSPYGPNAPYGPSGLRQPGSY